VSWRILCLSRGGLEVLELLFGPRPYAGSRARLTEDGSRTAAGVAMFPSTWVPIVMEMTLQCLGWQHSGEDGHTGLEVTEEMRSAGLMSRSRL
jgi:hypothetical protein